MTRDEYDALPEDQKAVRAVQLAELRTQHAEAGERRRVAHAEIQARKAALHDAEAAYRVILDERVRLQDAMAALTPPPEKKKAKR